MYFKIQAQSPLAHSEVTGSQGSTLQRRKFGPKSGLRLELRAFVQSSREVRYSQWQEEPGGEEGH